VRFFFLLLFIAPKLSFSQYDFLGIPQDKQKHFAASAALEGMIYITAYDFYYAKSPMTAHSKALLASTSLTISAGLVKELYDYTIHKRNGTWNDNARSDMYTDILSDILGTLSVSVTIDIFN
jgi:hypothetical protein